MNKVDVIAVIGARLNSSRLPNKHLLPLVDRPIIGHIFDRLDKCISIDLATIATTADSFNYPLITWAEVNQRCVYAYSLDVNDLVGRISEIVFKYKPRIIVYICGDCPLIDPGFIDSAVTQLMATASDTVELQPDIKTLH
jgi:spore coat polysaccharide biosynthesis protein SpsF (cytidylyltransferase family)